MIRFDVVYLTARLSYGSSFTSILLLLYYYGIYYMVEISLVAGEESYLYEHEVKHHFKFGIYKIAEMVYLSYFLPLKFSYENSIAIDISTSTYLALFTSLNLLAYFVSELLINQGDTLKVNADRHGCWKEVSPE